MGPRAHTSLAWQEVDLWLLFVPPRARRCREVVVRTLSDDSWSDLETHLEEEAPKVEPPRPTWEGALSPPGAPPPSAPPGGSALTLTPL